MRGAVRKKWPLRISSPCPARACVRHFLFSPNKSLLYREEGQPHMTGRRAPPVVIRGPSTRRRVSHAHRSRPSRRPPPRLADMHHVNPGFPNPGCRLQEKKIREPQVAAGERVASAIFIFRAKNCHRVEGPRKEDRCRPLITANRELGTENREPLFEGR